MKTAINNVLVLGNRGFIGRHLEARLKKEYPQLETAGLSRQELDLTQGQSPNQLKKHLQADTALIVCSGIKAQVGNDLAAFEKNIAMMTHICRALEAQPVARVLYLSSAAVYGEEVEDLRISEKTVKKPGSYYGIAKQTSELMLRQALKNHTDTTALMLRPPLIYGPNDPVKPYGPALFLDAVEKGEDIRMWGEGDEKREFLFIDDLTKMVTGLIQHPFDGVLNTVNGQSHTFADIIAILGELFPGKVTVKSRERSKAKVDCGFDASLLLKLLPDYRTTSLADGLKMTAQNVSLDKPVER
jgi:UDP-glucose 4-epimerase